MHSKRFNVWRWEAPLESFYGRAFREPHAEATSVRLATECSRSQSVEKRRMDVHSNAMTLGCYGFPLSSLKCPSSNFGRVHRLLSFVCRLFAVQISGICLWGPWSWHGCRLPPFWAGYKYGAGLFCTCVPSLAAVLERLRRHVGKVLKTLMGVPSSIAAVLKTAPSSRGENPEHFDGCSFINCCSLKTAPSSRGENPEDFDGCSFISCRSLKTAPSSRGRKS